VDIDQLKETVGSGRRFPFDLPRTDSANYLWIQFFFWSMNTKGPGWIRYDQFSLSYSLYSRRTQVRWLKL
jgi:hypothetical protein